MNMNRLRASMVLHGENITDLAKSLGMARQTLSSKMNGRREFTVGDVTMGEKVNAGASL
jgi:ActR/RegA family two-component response regulator